MKFWGNLLGYQAVWFCAVIAAAHGSAWPAPLAMLAFAAWQLAVSHAPRTDVRLMLAALACGLLIDGSLSLTGLAGYATAAPALPAGGAPLWILSLWLSFALVVNHSLRYLQRHLALAALFGALGGPLAYWCADRAWSVVTFAAPGWRALLLLAVGWALAMPLLAGLARAGVRGSDPAQPRSEGSVA